MVLETITPEIETSVAALKLKRDRGEAFSEADKTLWQNYNDTLSAQKNAKMAESMKRANRHIARLHVSPDGKGDQAAQLGLQMIQAFSKMVKVGREAKKDARDHVASVAASLKADERLLDDGVTYVRDLIEIAGECSHTPIYNRIATVLGASTSKAGNLTAVIAESFRESQAQ